MVVRRELTSREENARQNLKRIYQARKHQDRITQKDVSKWMGWSHSVFGQYITGRIPLNAKAVIKLAKYFNVYASDIDPLLDDEIIAKRGVVNLIQEATLLDPAIKADLCTSLAKTLPRNQKWELLQELLHQFDPTQSKS